ncbi:hypothetical protein REPUB_Repub03eG0106500 [Reevesia pubescens]
MAAGAGRGKATPKTTVISTKRKRKKHKPQNHLLTPQLVSLLSSATSAAHVFLLRHDLFLIPSQCLQLESLISSLSSLLTSPPPPPPPPFPPSPSPWFHRFLSLPSSISDPLWPRLFRMSKPTFSQLLFTLSPSFPHSFPPDFSLAAALFRLAHGGSYKFLARRFGFSSSADACRAYYTVCKLINDKLGNSLDFQSDISRIVVGFGWISLPNCCGVLGFGRFEVDGLLMGSNGSVLVQALVDSEGRFLDISAGWPCTIKPESILHQSKLFSRVEESRELLNGPCYKLTDGNSVPQYILGDSCFPLLPWLITPYVRSNEEGDSFSSPEKEFNAVHSRAMRLVEMAFGRVKARWQILSKKCKEECVEYLPFVIVTGCLLHNFLIKCSEPLPEENSGDSREDEDELRPVSEEEMDESGRRIRNAIAQHLNRELLLIQFSEGHLLISLDQRQLRTDMMWKI